MGGQVINKEFVTEPKYKSAASPEVFEKATYPELQSTGATEDRPLSKLEYYQRAILGPAKAELFGNEDKCCQ